MSISPKVFWIGMVVGLLSMSVAIQVTAITLANSSPSFAVEKDYERKAAEWDEHAKQLAVNATLGWTVDLSPVAQDRRVPGSPELYDLTIADVAGEPVEQVEVQIQAFHNARAAQVQEVTGFEIEPGRYRVALDVHQDGLWELRLLGQRDELRFTDVLRETLHSSL